MDGHEKSDDALVLAFARERDEAALDALIKRHWADAYRLALRALGDPASAEDAAQEAFIKLARGAPRYRTGTFEPWFRRLVVNAVKDHARAAGRRRRHEAEVARDRAVAAPGDGERRVLAAEIGERVARLPIDVRCAVLLHYYDGRPHEEVAAALGCPKGTAASRIRRGIERLREALGAAGYAAASGGLEEALRAAKAEDAASPAPAAPRAAAIRAAAAEAARTAAILKVAGAAAVVLALALGGLLTSRTTGEARGPGAGRDAAPKVASVTDRGKGGRVEAHGTPGAPPPFEGATPARRPLAPEGRTFGGKPATPSGRPGAPGTPAPSEAPEGTSRVYGRVTDERGAAVPDVEVVIAEPGGPGLSIALPDEGAPRGRSAADGGYEVAGIAPGSHVVLVRAPRHASPPPAAIEVAAETDLRHDIRLERGDSVRGRVVDPSGAPIGGIRVSVVGETPMAQAGTRRMVSAEGRSAETGPDGTFEISGFRGARYRACSAEDPAGRYAPWRGPFTDGIVITLEPMGEIHGRVVRADTGAPLEGAIVTVEERDGTPGRTLEAGGAVHRTAQATTGASGEFSMAAPAGNVTVWATAERFAAASQPIEVSAGMPVEVTIALGRGGTVEGIVTDRAGRPIAGAACGWKDPVDRSPVDRSHDAAVFSDREGRFTLSLVPLGPQTIVGAAEGYVPAEAAVEVGAGRTAQVALTLARESVIAGTVRLPGGRSPSKNQVAIVAPALGVFRQIPIGEDGSYRAGGLPAGTYTVHLFPPFGEDGKLRPRSVTVAEGETVRCDLDLTRVDGATVRGMVRLGGVPLASGAAMLTPLGPGSGFPFDGTINDGTFEIRGVPPGTYRLVIDGHGRRPLVVPPDAAEVPVEIDLPSLTIAGRVVDAAGAPVSGASVEAKPAGDADPEPAGLSIECMSGPDGTFAMTGLDDVPFTLTATHPELGPARVEGVRPSADPAAAPVTLALAAGGIVRVRVVGPDGVVVPLALVALTDAQGRPAAGRERPFVLDSGERIELTGVAPGSYTVLAAVPGGSFDRRSGVRIEAGENAIDMAIGPGGAMALTARDGRAGGAPLPGAQVEITFADGAALPPALAGDATHLIMIARGAPIETASDGTARREHLGPGEYRGRVVVSDGRSATFSATVRDGETTNVVVEVP
jgi:RNA polymerase sigma-70 factor (ECF subfamily)